MLRLPSRGRKPWVQPGTVRKLKSVLTAYRGGGLLPSNCGVRLPAAQVSTTRMRGMGLGLGGLDILMLPRFSVLARVWVLKLP